MLALKLAILLLLLAGCGIGPGLWITRPLRWTPLERLAATPAISFTLLALVSFALFLLDAPPAIYWACSGIATASTIAAIPQLVTLLKRHTVRRVLLTWIFLLGALLIDLLLIRVYEGANWWGDWFEHAERTQVFMHLLPVEHRFLSAYQLSARPPMMNLLAAFFCTQVGFQFELFSVVLVAANCWIFLPCCLALRQLDRRGMRAAPLLAALLIVNPCFVVNALYTWTKLSAAGLAILSISLYLAGLRSKRSSRVIGAMAMMAAGLLVHYSIFPYAVFLLLHFIYTIARGRRRNGLRELTAGGALVALILGTWIGWTWLRFGGSAALASNATVGALRHRDASTEIAIFAGNFVDMLVPHPLRGWPMREFVQSNPWGWRRDYLFVMYENSFPTMIGVIAWAAALRLTWKALANGRVDARLRMFWLGLIGVSIPLCVLLTPGRDYYGGAYLAMQTLSTLALCLIAARYDRLPWLLKWGVVVGAVFDFCFGVALELWMQSLPMTAHFLDPAKSLVVYDPYPGLGFSARANWTQKLLHDYGFWGDQVAFAAPALRAIMLVIGAGAIGILAHRAWRGGAATRPAIRYRQGASSSTVG